MIRKPVITKRRDIFSNISITITVIITFLILTLLFIVLFLSFIDGIPGSPTAKYTFANYPDVYFNSLTYDALYNTIIFSLTSLIISMLIGIPMAWLVERTDFPPKVFIFSIMTIGMLIPSFLGAMGWVFLLHPKIGIINQLLINIFHLNTGPLSVTNVLGMGWIEGLNLAPLAFIMTVAVFKAMDPTLEEAAHINGASWFQTMTKITTPLMIPAITAASIYIFTICLGAFDVPAIIGWANRIYTLSTYIYLQTSPQQGLPRYGIAAALSSSFVVIAILMSIWYNRILKKARNFEIISGKGYKPKMVKLGHKRIRAWVFVIGYILISFVMPIIVLIWTSLFTFLRPPTLESFQFMTLKNYTSIPWDLIIRGSKNTFLLMLLVPTTTLIISIAFSWIVLRSRIKRRLFFDSVAFLPHVIPSIIFAVGSLLFALFVLGKYIPIYGTIWILLLVFIIVRLSFGTRVINGVLIQIHHDLEEAAYVNGARTWDVMRKIIIPLLTPSLLNAWLWIALLTYRELTIPTILSTPNNITLPVVIWSFWLSGGMGQAAAASVIMIIIMIPLIFIYWLLGRKIVSKSQGINHFFKKIN